MAAGDRLRGSDGLRPAPRPELVRSLRDVAAGIPAGADIAVLALGTALGGSEDVFLAPASRSDLAGRPELLETEAIRLGDLLRRLADRRPRELVAVVNECRPTLNSHCPLDGAVGASGASLVAAERVDTRGSGAPVAAQASLRDPLLRATTQEGRSFLQFFEALGAGLARGFAAFASSPVSARRLGSCRPGSSAGSGRIATASIRLSTPPASGTFRSIRSSGPARPAWAHIRIPSSSAHSSGRHRTRHAARHCGLRSPGRLRLPVGLSGRPVQVRGRGPSCGMRAARAAAGRTASRG